MNCTEHCRPARIEKTKSFQDVFLQMQNELKDQILKS